MSVYRFNKVRFSSNCVRFRNRNGANLSALVRIFKAILSGRFWSTGSQVIIPARFKTQSAHPASSGDFKRNLECTPAASHMPGIRFLDTIFWNYLALATLVCALSTTGRNVSIIKTLWHSWRSVRRRNLLADIRICDKEHEKGANSFRKEHKNITSSMDCMSITHVKH